MCMKLQSGGSNFALYTCKSVLIPVDTHTHTERNAYTCTHTRLRTNRGAAQSRVRMSGSSSIGQSNKTKHVQRQ